MRGGAKLARADSTLESQASRDYLISSSHNGEEGFQIAVRSHNIANTQSVGELRRIKRRRIELVMDTKVKVTYSTPMLHVAEIENSIRYSINGSSEIGNLTWNGNGSLKTLAITDPFNAGDAQTCSANCGSVWSQTFTYDSFGNVTKSGSIAWQPGFTPSTNRYALGGTSYDANGNLLNDSFHTYTWNASSRPVTIDTIGLTYDAFDRMVEQNQSGTFSAKQRREPGAQVYPFPNHDKATPSLVMFSIRREK